MTQGNCVAGVSSGWNFHHEHCSLSPRLFSNSMSERVKRAPQWENSAGPRSDFGSYVMRGGLMMAFTSSS